MTIQQADKIIGEIKDMVRNYDLDIEDIEYIESVMGGIIESKDAYFGMEPD